MTFSSFTFFYPKIWDLSPKILSQDTEKGHFIKKSYSESSFWFKKNIRFYSNFYSKFLFKFRWREVECA